MHSQPLAPLVIQNKRVISENAAWLQTGGVPMLPPMRLEAQPDFPAAACEELRLGLERLYGKDFLAPDADCRLLLSLDEGLPPEGFRLTPAQNCFTVEGADESGALYGIFSLLLRLGAGEALENISGQSAPTVARRVLNHWDNLNGSIERGYAGNSIFFEDNNIRYDTQRIHDYARLLASIGINVVILNNVNVTPESSRLITESMLPQVAELAAIFRRYRIRLGISIHFESPQILGGLPTADPLDEQVTAWWQAKADEVYRYIPDFSGFLVKADSEFRGGPNSIGRSQAEGANTIARALAPYGGVLYWRCFIYNCMQDWREYGIDRPKAPYDLFMPQDGQFDANVILQVKNGPSDFQVREPVSPLLGAMHHTRQALELQITQEYTGQQIDVFNLAVQWQEILSSPIDRDKSLRDICGNKIDTIVAVANVGRDNNWTGHTFAQANLFAFGRLAWNPLLDAQEITEQWARLTFGLEPAVLGVVTDILMRSRHTYEKYNAPLGLGWMVNIHHHYGPSPEGYEFMKWGTYHRASGAAVGIDRTTRGTGFTAQYPDAVTAMYDDTSTCPEELLLFFHRLNYDYRLKNGKTLLQHIYDTHFEGAEDVADFVQKWASLKELLPQEVHVSVAERLQRQLENAREWRDVINTYFYRKTGIPDERGRNIYH